MREEEMISVWPPVTLFGDWGLCCMDCAIKVLPPELSTHLFWADYPTLTKHIWLEALPLRADSGSLSHSGRPLGDHSDQLAAGTYPGGSPALGAFADEGIYCTTGLDNIFGKSATV